MDTATLTALKTSIRHWEENMVAATPELVSVEGDDCALCAKFWRCIGDSCNGCPVRWSTGYTMCCGSPFYDTVPALRDWLASSNSELAKWAWRDAAEEEYKFLCGLLPEGEVAR